MKNEDRIVELLTESLKKFDRLSDQMDILTGRVDNLTSRVDNLTSRVDNLTSRVDNLTHEVVGVKDEMIGMNSRLDKVESGIVMLNLISAENSRALIKLGDSYDRISRLEKAVFK